MLPDPSPRYPYSLPLLIMPTIPAAKLHRLSLSEAERNGLAKALRFWLQAHPSASPTYHQLLTMLLNSEPTA